MRCHLFASLPAIAEEQKMVTELTLVLKRKKGGILEMIVRQVSTYASVSESIFFPSVLFCTYV